MSRPDSTLARSSNPVLAKSISSSNSTKTPSILTRSMSRKTLTTSTNNSGLLVRDNNIARRSSSVRPIPTSSSIPSRTIPTASSSKPSTSTSRSLVGTAPRRSILCELNDVGKSGMEVGGGRIHKPLIKARPISSVSGVVGMGVRAGPSVVAQRTSPTKMLGERARDSLLFNRDAEDPFSLNFRPELIVARTVGGGQKRGFEEENSHSVDENGNGRRERNFMDTSPQVKRTHYEAHNQSTSATSNAGPSIFTSPQKSSTKTMSTTPKMAPPPSPTRPRFHLDESDFDTMDVDAVPIPRSSHKRRELDYRNVDIPSSSPAPSHFSSRKKPRPTSSNSSDDELDFLSPRKKPKPASEESIFARRSSQPNFFPTANSTSSLRSPPKRLPLPPSPAKPRISSGATSVPMSRPFFALPPLPAFSRRPSTTTSSLPLLATIDPQLLSKAPIPLPLSVESILAAPIAISKPSLVGVGPRKSGIPRLVPVAVTLPPILPPSPLPLVAPRLPSLSSQLPSVVDQPNSIFSSYDAPTLFDSSSTSNRVDETLDQTFNTTLDLDSTMGDLANITSTSVGQTSVGGMSEETAKRLVNLQSMLSKLAMPRQSSGGNSSTSSTPSSSQELKGGKMLPPMINGVGKERKENLGRDRRRLNHNATSSFREEYEVPISGGSLSADADLATTIKRLDKPSGSSRPALPSTSIYNTSRSIGMGPPPLPSGSSSSSSSSSSSTRAPRRTSVASASSSTAAISAIAEGELSAKPKSNVLKGVVAFVDVRTLEGDDAGMIFVDMLKSMGARVTTRPTLTLTHIVYKSGRPGTLHRLRAHPDPKPFLVGISWVVRCAEVGMRVQEKNYIVESENQPVVMHKRRRSMEPKAFASLSSSLGAGGTTATDPALRATIAASIERARRKSLQFQPRIGSPLAKRVFMMPTEETDDEEMS